MGYSKSLKAYRIYFPGFKNIDISKDVEGLPKMQTKHEGVCKGSVKRKNIKKTFPSSKSKEKGILEITTLMYVVQCHQVH